MYGIQNPYKTFCVCLCMQRTKRPALCAIVLTLHTLTCDPKDCFRNFSGAPTGRRFPVGFFRDRALSTPSLEYAICRPSPSKPRSDVHRKTCAFLRLLHTRLVNEHRASFKYFKNALLHFLLKKPLCGGTHFARRGWSAKWFL